MTRFLLFALLSASPAIARDIEPEKVAPGLAVTYNNGVISTDSRIALNIPANESVDPRVPAGAFTATWEGTINIFRNGTYTFDAATNGRFSVEIDGREIALGKPMEIASGIYPFSAGFESPAGPAKLEFRWQPPQQRMEPVPHEILGHLKAKPVDTTLEHGRFLFEEQGCANCHASETPSVERKGPNLSKIAGRVHAGWIEAWLTNPSKLRPNTAMPHLFADTAEGKKEIRDVTAYLATLGGPPKDNAKAKNPKDIVKSVGSGKVLFESLGCTACHAKNGEKITYDQGALGSKFTIRSLADFLLNPHATHPTGRMPNMLLNGTEALDLARFLITKIDTTIPAKASGGDVELGKKLVVSKGCVNCHQIGEGKNQQPVSPAPAFAAVRKNVDTGCQSAKPKASISYNLTAEQRKELSAFVLAKEAYPGAPSSAYIAKTAFERFHCTNCHQRDSLGGLSTEIAEQMKRHEKGENIDDVRPPTLSGVGGKLRTSWAKKVLLEAGRSRPWTNLRMPQFDEKNVGILVEGLARLEGLDPDDKVHVVAASKEMIEAGRKMLGKDGLGCITCHDIAGIQNSGTRGPDLATTNQRVRYEWYRRWLEVPQKMAPNTKMPQVFVDGKSPLPKLLDGHADKQADAMWAYMALGVSMPLPAGLEPPKGMVIAVGARPEVVRTFMPDLGSRGIAVGYPGNVNFAFDAGTCRLVYAWTGNFLDAAPIWNNRGGQQAKLLGNKLWTGTAANPWAVTSSTEPPDFKGRQGNAAFGAMLPHYSEQMRPESQPPPKEKAVNFQGYSLDSAGNPVFRYTVKGDSVEPLEVSEKPTPLQSTLAYGINRQFHIKAPEGQKTWLQVATSVMPFQLVESADKVTELNPGDKPPANARIAGSDGDRPQVYMIHGRSCEAAWHIRKTGDTYELLLEVKAKPKSDENIGVHTWMPSKLDRQNLEFLFETK